MSTLHTIDAGETINRILAMFAMADQGMVRNRLAHSIRFIVSQRLLPRKDQGRIAALEVMGSSLRVRELIMHGEPAEKSFYGVISDSKPYGWQTFDQHIIELFQQGLVTQEVAKGYCTDHSVVNRAVDHVRSARGEETSDLGSLQMAHARKLKRP